MTIRVLEKLVLLACVALGAACSGDDAAQGTEALSKGAGDGPPVWASDPCSDPNIHTSAGVKVSVSNGVHTFVGTPGKDVIVGTDGVDIIWGNDGDDVICAGNGDDEVHGGNGDDYIDGGYGNDTLEGGAGNDLIHGRAGSDTIHGGDGDDICLGDLLDDKLFGDDGDDLLIGGHGTDEIHGGKGNDYMRGDTGNDSFFGDEGSDVVSFMTAMPPVTGDPTNPAYAQGMSGVVVDFSDPCINPDSGSNQPHQACAYGDGQYEPLDDVEIVIGSPYDDYFRSGGDQKFIGGFGDDKFDVPHKSQIIDGSGNDTWNGQPFGSPGAPRDPNKVFVFVDGHARDLGVLVVGTSNADDVTVRATQAHEIEVEGKNGTKIDTNQSCNQINDALVRCDIPNTLRYVAAYADDGNDTITFAGDFPRDFTAHASGGRGSDHLYGGDEQDVLFSGIDGEDWLYGNGGDDALLSESHPSFNAAKLTSNPAYTDGRDHLFGGSGNDQLVADFPCGGHEYHGGEGIDIAGFARSGSLPIHAQLAQQGDNPSIKMPFYGYAYNPQGVPGYNGAYCTVAQGTSLAPDLEILEASSANDLLYGNDFHNVIWGREGDDEIHGLGGDDHLFGLSGNDRIYGEGGQDVLEGGEGFDHIYAGGDNERDVCICGPSGGRVETMDSHDEVTGCKYK